MERLRRGVVAINQGSGKVVVSWRLLEPDPGNITFNLYRIADDNNYCIYGLAKRVMEGIKANKLGLRRRNRSLPGRTRATRKPWAASSAAPSWD